MPIQEQNIKFLASQVMDDVPEGGGAATGTEIEDGVMNNVFEDISDLDRAMGRFNLRKLFLAVRTLSTDLFGGAKTVVTALPEDAAIGYTLFSTNDAFDTREQAANRVEAYLFKGGMWPGALYENHIAGMRQIRVIQREGSELPARGKTLCIVQNEGEPDEREQYVRVTDVDATLQTFSTSSNTDYKRLIVTMDLSDALRHDFTGHTVNPTDDYNYTTRARLRDTTVADATRYFGAQKTTAPAVIGDKMIRAQSMFTQLVPAAQTEEPLANQTLNPSLIQTISAGTRDVEISQQAHTLARQVTAENRRYNWIETLTPVPGPSAYSISYMAQGNWYTLTDDGAGIISGSDPGFGSGTIDYVTGNVSVTLGALPDAGSQIIHVYGSRVHYENRSGADSIASNKIKLRFSVAQLPVAPETLTAAWPAGGATKNATCNASGVISGDATGEFDPVTGEGFLLLDQLPDRGGNLAIGYDYNISTTPGETLQKTESVNAGSTITLSAAPAAGSLRLKLWVSGYDGMVPLQLVAQSRGTDLVVPEQNAANTNKYRVASEQTIGTISGSTITLSTTDVAVESSQWAGGGWMSTSA
ncbi:hypothetical protein [Marinobacter sp.]|uniref:hypothetical protein n=1 Tax=Marinobacter sp. TaxID=50741 RepID=UPI003A935CFC